MTNERYRCPRCERSIRERHRDRHEQVCQGTDGDGFSWYSFCQDCGVAFGGEKATEAHTCNPGPSQLITTPRDGDEG